jgi:hypothetical protein
MKKIPTLKILSLTVCCLAPLGANAQTIISDTFSLNPLAGRSAGAPLAGTAPEVGSGTTYGAVFGTKGAVFGTAGGLVQTSGDINGAILYNPSAAPAPSGPLTESIGLNFGGVDNNTGGSTSEEYLAFGVGGSPYGVGGFLTDQGTVVITDTTSGGIGSYAIPNFNDSLTYNFALTYDQSTQELSAYINGIQVIAPTSLGSNGFANAPLLADFFGGNLVDTPDATLTSLDVLQGAAVPEPSSMSLVVGGLFLAGVMVIRRRHRLV